MGSISMARGGPDSATSEFFICVGDQPELDFGGGRNADGQGFAAFGTVVAGMDVVQAIHRSTAEAQVLQPPIRILSIERIPVEIGGAWTFGDVEFPATIDSFLVLGAERWPDPDLGAVLHYATGLDPRSSADVHVRAAPQGRLDDEAMRVLRSLGYIR